MSRPAKGAGLRQPPGALRVVHVVISLDVGGLENVVFDLARRSDRHRVLSQVVCIERIGALGPKFAAAGIPVESLGTTNPVFAGRRLASRLRELDPHIVHTHNLKAQIVSVLARIRRPSGTLIHTKHGRNEGEGWRARVYGCLASRMCDAIVAVSEDEAEMARRQEGVPSQKLKVFHNGIDLRAYAPGARQSPGHAPVAVCVARLSPLKDHATLLHAVSQVVRVLPGLRLQIVGEGPMRQSIEALRDDLGLRESVSLLGERHDVARLLGGADVFVLPSWREGLSIAILEAMAAGLPVVATWVGGNPELVEHGRTGFLVPPRSPGPLAEALVAVLSEPGRCLQMGREARAHVEAHFDLIRTVERYERLYYELARAPLPLDPDHDHDASRR